MKIADSILVDAPVERVFDVVKERHVEVWAQTDYDLYYPEDSGQSNQAGARFVQVVRGLEAYPWIYTITAHEKPHRIALEVVSGQFTAKPAYTITADANATRLSYSCEIHINNLFARILGPLLMAKRSRHDTRRALEQFKSIAER